MYASHCLALCLSAQGNFEKGGCVFHTSLRKKNQTIRTKTRLDREKRKKKTPQMQLLACLTEQTLTSSYHLYKRLVGLNYLKHAFPFFFFSSNIIILKMMSKVYLFVEGMELLF